MRKSRSDAELKAVLADLRGPNTERDRFKDLLKEAVKIVHCHARNTDRDWLQRARAALRSANDGGEKHGK